jgi:hypothetical protein
MCREAFEAKNILWSGSSRVSTPPPLTMDFDSRVTKFEKEKEKRKKLAKEKLSHELRAQRMQEERDKALAEIAEKKREEQAQLLVENELREIEENRITGGIDIVLTLQAIPTDLENDKVKLPQSVLNELHTKGAFSCGRPVMFQIQPQSVMGGRITHCGVLEFTAEEGTIEIPTKVYQNLFIETIDSISPPTVTLKYIVLPKITAVQFQPKLNLFSQLGPIKLILEENLQQHTTLTLGDTLTIWSRGQAHEIVVTDLEPKDELVHCGGTVIDTNIEVSLEYSQEYLHKIQTETQINSSTSTSLPPSKSLTAANAPPATSPHQPLRALLPEPPLDSVSVTFKMLFPSGGKAVHRFLLSSPIDEIFLFLRHHLAESAPPAEKLIQISTRQSPIKIFKETDLEPLQQQQIESSGLVTLPAGSISRNLSEVLVVSFV